MLVADAITNVTTQDDQLAIFANAAAHLAAAGFALPVLVPQRGAPVTLMIRSMSYSRNRRNADP